MNNIMKLSHRIRLIAICWLWSSTCTEWRNQRMQLYDRERQNQISFRISCNAKTLPKYPKPHTNTVTGPDECNRIHSHIYRLLQSLVLYVVGIVVISIGKLSHPCRFVYNETHVLPAAALVMCLYYPFTPFKLYSRIWSETTSRLSLEWLLFVSKMHFAAAAAVAVLSYITITHFSTFLFFNSLSLSFTLPPSNGLDHLTHAFAFLLVITFAYK